MLPISSIEAAEGLSSMHVEPRTMPLSPQATSRLGKRKSRWGDRVVQPALQGKQGERGNSITPGDYATNWFSHYCSIAGLQLLQSCFIVPGFPRMNQKLANTILERSFLTFLAILHLSRLQLYMKMSWASSDTQISDGGGLQALAGTIHQPFNGDIMRNGDV